MPIGEFHMFYSNMSCGIATQSMCKIVIRGSTTKEVALEIPWVFYSRLPFVTLSYGTSLVLCPYGVKLENKWPLRLSKLMTSF